jgi:glycyl-tRNA synthetase alpha subunit
MGSEDTTEDRFLQYINKTDGCWLWTGYTMKAGYGQFSIKNVMKRAHRVAYALWVGEIPIGGVVHHTCAVRNCVNPEHLQVVSQHANVAEMLERQHYIARIKELEETVESLENEIRTRDNAS